MAETGTCHCKQIEFEVKLEEKAHILCHCDTCKILSGGTFTLNQIVPKRNLTITKGRLNKYTYYGDSGKSVDCYYCPNCTVHIYHDQAIMGDKYVVHTMLLKDAKSMWPSAEIYGKARLPWEKEVATTFATMPPSKL